MKPAPTIVRTVIALCLFAVQIAGIAYARFVPARYLCWAPYDEIVFYEVEVQLPGRTLGHEDAFGRYRIPRWGRINRSWAHVTDTIAHYENTLGAGDGARVRVRYTVNGRGPFLWRWPEQGPRDAGVAVSTGG